MELTLQYRLVSEKVLIYIGYNPCFYGINFAIRTWRETEKSNPRLQSLFLWN